MPPMACSSKAASSCWYSLMAAVCLVTWAWASSITFLASSSLRSVRVMIPRKPSSLRLTGLHWWSSFLASAMSRSSCRTNGAEGAMLARNASRACCMLSSLSLGDLGGSAPAAVAAAAGAAAVPVVEVLVGGGARGGLRVPCCWADFVAAIKASRYDLRVPHDLQVTLVTQLPVPQEVHL